MIMPNTEYKRMQNKGMELEVDNSMLSIRLPHISPIRGE